VGTTRAGQAAVQRRLAEQGRLFWKQRAPRVKRGGTFRSPGRAAVARREPGFAAVLHPASASRPCGVFGPGGAAAVRAPARGAAAAQARRNASGSGLPTRARAQVVEDGYEFFAKRQLVTIFSAPNYCGEFDNAGAMMSVDETLMCSFQVGGHMAIGYRVCTALT
jgi:hypothetical protein